MSASKDGCFSEEETSESSLPCEETAIKSFIS